MGVGVDATNTPGGDPSGLEGKDERDAHKRVRGIDGLVACGERCLRLATLIVGLVAAIGTGIQSCAVSYTSNVAENLSRQTGQVDKESEKLTAAGGFGILGAIMWLVAAGLVTAKPRISTWIFGLCAIPWIVANSQGFSDAAGWAVVSVVLAVMARAGEREALRAQIQAAQQPPPPPAAVPAGWYPDPHGTGMRWWDGNRWTDSTT